MHTCQIMTQVKQQQGYPTAIATQIGIKSNRSRSSQYCLILSSISIIQVYINTEVIMIQNKHEKALPSKKADIANRDDSGQQTRPARRRRQRSGAGDPASEQIARLVMDQPGAREGNRAQNAASKPQRPRRKQNQPKKIDVFEPHQTKILQKWFLDNIQRPYVKPADKELLTRQTGLDGKQISGWFTNNRKRKYSKVLEAAKKKNKDFSYVRDVMRVKFDRNLDQSSSLSGQSQSSFSLNKQQRSDKWNVRRSSKDGVEDQEDDDSVEINEAASQKRRRGKSNARSNLIKSLPFLENDEVDALKKQRGPEKGNVEPMDVDRSEDTVQKSQIVEKSEVAAGQNSEMVEAKKAMQIEDQDTLLGATPCQVTEKFELPLPKTIISDQSQWSPLKFMASLGKTIDRINETATRASLSGIPIDPRSYQSQLLQTLQGSQGTKIEYFTIRNQGEDERQHLGNDELDESQNQNESPPGLVPHGQRGKESNELKEKHHDQIVDTDINMNNNNLDKKARQNRRTNDRSRRRDASQDANVAGVDRGQLQPQQNLARSKHPSEDSVSGPSVEALQSDARLCKRHEVEKLCQRTQFIPIVLMWCPNLLAGQPCGCGYRSLPTVPNIKDQVRTFLHKSKVHHKRTQKSIHLNGSDLCKGNIATQMDKNMDDQQIDSGTQFNKHNNLAILKEQTNQSGQNKVLRAWHAGGGNSGQEHRRDGKERLGDQVKSAYDQENILKNEGQKYPKSDHFQTNINFAANQDNDHELGHKAEIHYSKQKGPLIIATNQTNEILQTEAQDATGLAKQQEKLGQLRGHEQYQASPLLKLSPSFQEQHKIGPIDAKKEGSVLTQIYEQDFHLSNKLGHVTQVNDGGGLLRYQSAMRVGDNNQYSPFRQVQANYAADIDFDRRKFRTQQVKKEQGLGVQEDLLEEAKENYSSLEPQIQSLFQKLLLRIVDEQMSSLDRHGGNAAQAFKQQDQQVAGERPDAAVKVISKSETSRQVLDDLDQFVGSKEREAQKQHEMNLLTRLILRQMIAEGGQQLIEAQFLGRPNPDRAALGWQLIHGLSLEQIQASQSARQQFKRKQSPELQTNAQILQDQANIPLQREMPHDEHSLLPRLETSKTGGQPKDQREGHQVLNGGKRPADADRQCSDPQTESPPQKHSDLSVEGAFVNQSGPDNNSGQSAHSGQNADGNVGSGNGGSSDQRQEAVHQQIKENTHAVGNADSNPSNLNPSHNPGSQTSSINRQKKGAVAEDAPEHAARAEPPEEEEVRSDEVCCERPGVKHKNLSNDVNQPKNEQSPLNELRNSQEAPRHGTTSGEGKDTHEKDNSGNKTVGGASAPQLVSNNALIGVRLDDSGAMGSASINNKGAQPTMMMAMAAGYDCQLMAGPRSSLRTPTVPIIDRSHPKTNSDPTKDDREQQMNSMNYLVGASSRGAEPKDAEMINANYGPKRNGREGQVPRHETAPDWRYVRESQQRVTENKVVKHIFDLQHGQHQHPKRSQDQQEAHVWVHSRSANLDREAGRRKNHRHYAAEERRRSMHRSRAAHEAPQNVHGQSFMLPYPGYPAEGQVGLQPYGSYFADNSQGVQPPPAPPLDLDRLLAQYPSSIPSFMQAEQKPTQLPAQTMNNGGQQPSYSGPDSQLQYPRVDNINIQGASGPTINQDGGRGAMPLNEPSTTLPNSQEWPRGARHDKAVHAGVAVASYLREPASDGQAFLGSSPARISLPQPPAFAHRDPRVAPSNIAPPTNMLAESQLGRPLIGSGGQVLNISYPLQQINLIPIEVLSQSQAQPRATSPFLYNPQPMLANPAISGVADVSGNLHPRQVNEKLGEVLSHALPNSGELHRPEFYSSLQGQPPALYPDPSSLLPPNAHQQPPLMHPNQLRGHQLKMGQIDQMHLNYPYNTAVQDLAEVYNAQQELYPPQGQARMNQFAGQSQMGGSSIKMEQQHGPQFDNQEMQNMELQQVLEETQHVILKQLNQINSHSRHLFPQGLPANKEDGGNGRVDTTDPKATPVRRKEGHQQRPQSQLQMQRQLPVSSPATRQDQQVLTTVQEREIHRNIAQLFELMGQQQSIYQTLVAQRLAPGNPGTRPVAHASALAAQLPNSQRMVDPMQSIQYIQQRRERAPSQVLAEREALLQAQTSGEQPRLAVNRNPEELFEIPAPVEPSRHDSARVQRQSPGSGPSQFANSKHPNSK